MIFSEYDPIRREQDPDKKADLRKTFVESVVPKYYGRLEATIADNQGSPFLVGKKLSWVDLMLVHYFEIFETLLPEFPDFLVPYPGLQNLRKTVLEIPQIKEWVEKRPKTPF